MKHHAFLTATLFLLACAAAQAHKDRVEPARTLSIDFSTGGKVVFEMTKSAVTAVNAYIDSSKYPVPPDVCARLRPQEIHFNTVKLLWNGSYKTAAQSDYFHIQFVMGAVGTKPYAEFPPVDLLFRDGKFSNAHGLSR